MVVKCPLPSWATTAVVSLGSVCAAATVAARPRPTTRAASFTGAGGMLLVILSFEPLMPAPESLPPSRVRIFNHFHVRMRPLSAYAVYDNGR
jgi:hypothetical protein